MRRSWWDSQSSFPVKLSRVEQKSRRAHFEGVNKIWEVFYLQYRPPGICVVSGFSWRRLPSASHCSHPNVNARFAFPPSAVSPTTTPKGRLPLPSQRSFRERSLLIHQKLTNANALRGLLIERAPRRCLSDSAPSTILVCASLFSMTAVLDTPLH